MSTNWTYPLGNLESSSSRIRFFNPQVPFDLFHLSICLFCASLNWDDFLGLLLDRGL